MSFGVPPHDPVVEEWVVVVPEVVLAPDEV